MAAEVKDKPAPAPKAPDNNKRLAALEAGVATLAIALTANGFKVEDGADPVAAAISAIKGQASKIDELAAAGTPGTDAAELEELRRQNAELKQDNAELQTDLTEITNAKNVLANQLAAEGKGTGEVPPAAEPAPEPEPEPEVRPEAARDVGPNYNSLTEVAIGALVAEGGQFEIAFSNGDFEILGLQPVKLGVGDLVRVDSSRWIVKPAIQARGGAGVSRIAGAGLLYRGEQVAYCPFDPVMKIEPGQERRFDRCLIFG